MRIDDVKVVKSKALVRVRTTAKNQPPSDDTLEAGPAGRELADLVAREAPAAAAGIERAVGAAARQEKHHGGRRSEYIPRGAATLSRGGST